LSPELLTGAGASRVDFFGLKLSALQRMADCELRKAEVRSGLRGLGRNDRFGAKSRRSERPGLALDGLWPAGFGEISAPSR